MAVQNIRRNMTEEEIELLYSVYYWVQGPVFILLSTVGMYDIYKALSIFFSFNQSTFFYKTPEVI